MKTVSITRSQMQKRIARFDDVATQTRDDSMPADLVSELRAATVLGVITSTPPAAARRTACSRSSGTPRRSTRASTTSPR